MLNMKFLNQLTIASCYVPPCDSHYHSYTPLMEIQDRFSQTPKEDGFLVLGDLNARFGNERRMFLDGKFPQNTNMSYSLSPDQITHANANAKYVGNTIGKHLILINGLLYGEKSFPTALTYRQRTRWVSELDVALISPQWIPVMRDFTIHQRTDLPSDHAPVSCEIAIKPRIDGDYLRRVMERSAQLGTYDVDISNDQATRQDQYKQRKPIRMNQLDRSKIEDALRRTQPPTMNFQDINQLAETTTNTLYNIAQEFRKTTQHDSTAQSTTNGMRTDSIRWRDLLDKDDPKELWKAIGWNGTVNESPHVDTPSDEEFKNHFEELLNNPDSQNGPVDRTDTRSSSLYLPVTDDPIEPREVLDAIKHIKPNKSGGPSGLPPGLLKLLPSSWIIFLAGVFTHIFSFCCYPQSWSFTKLIVLFKKGSRKNCTNYRGISLMDTLAKLYDAILNRRLSLWFTPDREQAGAQKERGCTEHIITLRMLIDYAKHKRQRLYTVFVDFSKAYDRVPRQHMLQRLSSLGCGSRMIQAIETVYQSTKMILKTAIITASVGVRQGSPTSCLLFTLVVNDLIRSIKGQSAPDGFLGWLHIMMMMDDTILLATSRKRAEEKVKILTDFCSRSGMAINEGKTQFMVINGDEEDKQPIEVEDSNGQLLKIQNCNKYTYLGCIFTQDGNLRSAVKAQCDSKIPHTAKFEAFVKKNTDAPYLVKEKVFSAALTSSILYGCESWLSQAAADCASAMYLQCIRCLLGVRKTTATEICLIEAGLPSVCGKVKAAQKRTFVRLVESRRGRDDDPFWFIYQKCIEANTPCSRYIRSLDTFDCQRDIDALKLRVQNSPRTKYSTYRTIINPALSRHAMYSDKDILEPHRIVTTRFRLSSHNLAIEKGRWLRKPREERICPTCTVIQDEQHALRDCLINAPARRDFRDLDLALPAFFDGNPPRITSACYKLIKDFA